jgi:hypothetical protein
VTGLTKSRSDSTHSILSSSDSCELRPQWLPFDPRPMHGLTQAMYDGLDVTFTPGCGFKIADPFLNLQFGFIRVMRCVPHDLESSNFVMPCVA